MTRSSVSAEPLSILTRLVGLPVTLLEASYGGELVVGIGSTHASRRPLTGLEAEWMLYTQMSDWTVEGREGVVSTSRRRDYVKAVDAARPAVIDRTVADVSVRNGALGLTFRLEEGASILILPDAADVRRNPNEEVWVLHGPDNLLVAAIPADGIVLGDPHATV